MLDYFRDALKLYFKVTVGKYTALFLFLVLVAVGYSMYRLYKETTGAAALAGAGAGRLRGHYAYFYKPSRMPDSVVSVEELGN